MGDIIDFKKPKKRKAPTKPLDDLTKIEYEIKQFLAIRCYFVDHFEIKKANGKVVIGIAISV